MNDFYQLWNQADLFQTDACFMVCVNSVDVQMLIIKVYKLRKWWILW